MSQSAPAEDSAQPSDSTPSQYDERNDEVAADENASLLPPDDISPRAGVSSPKAIYILTSLALAFSISTLIFLIAAQIALAAGPNNFELGWMIRENMKASIAPAIISLLISAFNLARLRRNLTAAPLLVNIILDILLAIFAILYGASGLGGTDSGYCYNWGPFDPDEYTSCMRHGLPSRIFAGIAFGSAIVFGTVHLALFVVRCIVAFRSKIWKGPWGFPDGQLTVELSLKLFKEPQKPREVGIEAV